ncbi:LysR family transcriptional regulator [Methylobacterium gregans]|uniref:Hydrogen peroxide-inducible genes activator n=1 Tax=Methylobacterium gregans TaxID=374424 RepID=A0AA37HK12_9HYPH|nr:LysR family transcriptional regulator [Methylobacterium gregans]MDQ0519786.1 DNA-binding transcriptional LysR family regulator [Methylobacterium gregans]GJD76944.1 Hydrogen peroxide-inducible genes activator [Methylobacterium gregans]GLS54092.1 LysR family transcriptional regulator [Methylobacterium gregans]
MIDKLDFLLALAREQHFGHAAEVCGVTQQTLSAGVKQLENRFGVQLVLRGSRFQGFTPEGERVLEWARRIVADARAMHEDVSALRKGLTGHLRIAAIPTALPMAASLTTPYRARHPDVRLTVESTTSTDIFSLIENLEADAGLTYLDNEPLGRVIAVPLYRERYRLLTSAGGPYAERASVTWAEVGRIPLCLLTPNMQNRRIIDQQIRAAGQEPSTTLESNSMIVLMTHVRTLRWASVLPEILIDALGPMEGVRALPITAPSLEHTIGLVAAKREPSTPMVTALVAIARGLTRTLDPTLDGTVYGFPQEL